MTFRARQPRVEDPRYLDFVRGLPCLFTGRQAEAAHVRYGDPRFAKAQPGVGAKPSDCWALPLSPEMHRLDHRSQHGSGERKWWQKMGVDPLPVCLALYRAYLHGDHAGALQIIAENRPRIRP